MITENGEMTTEIIYSDDRKNRYLLRKTWGEGEKAMLLMTNAGTADVVAMDYTTLYSVRNLNLLNFGGVDIVNLTSEITTKIEIPKDGELKEDTENTAQILSSAETADKIIIAWGKLGDNTKKIRLMQLKILEKLRPYADKLYQICDDNGEVGFHPLAPNIRSVWHLVKFALPEKKEDTAEVKTTKKDKKKQSQNVAPATKEFNTADTNQLPNEQTA